MDIVRDIQPMTAFRNHSADLMRHLKQSGRPFRDLIRRDMQRDGRAVRDAVVAGYRDAGAGRIRSGTVKRIIADLGSAFLAEIAALRG
jgi:hypothetical protein